MSKKKAEKIEELKPFNPSYSERNLLAKARSEGISMIPVDSPDKPEPKLYGYKEFGDVVILFASLLTSLINKNFSWFELGKKLLDSVIGYKDIMPEFLDLDEQEFLEVYNIFKDHFTLSEQNEKLESFIEKSFLNIIRILQDVAQFVTQPKES